VGGCTSLNLVMTHSLRAPGFIPRTYQVISWLIAPGFNPRTYQVISWFQPFAAFTKFILYRYASATTATAGGSPAAPAAVITIMTTTRGTEPPTGERRTTRIRAGGCTASAAVGLYTLSSVDT
jgi:hypothetical protein